MGSQASCGKFSHQYIFLKQYLKAVTAEQLQAQVTPTQVTPFFH